MIPGAAKRRQPNVAEFSRKRAGIQDDAGQIRQHSPLNSPQHLGPGAASAAAEASTSTNTSNLSTSKEQQMEVITLLRELHQQYCVAQGEELITIQKLMDDAIKNALATGKLTADEVGATGTRVWEDPTVTDKGSRPRSPTGIVDDTGCNALVADASLPEDEIIDNDPDFFNAFEDDFDDKDLD